MTCTIFTMHCTKSAVKWLPKSAPLRCWKRTCSQLVALEYQEPKYPPIIDTSPEGLKRHERQLLYDRVKALPTIDEKLYALSESRSYFERTYRLSCCPSSYVGVPFYRFITRTHFIEGLPDLTTSKIVDAECEALKPQLTNAIVKHFGKLWRLPDSNAELDPLREKECGSKLFNELFVHACSRFAPQNHHLLRAACDPRSRICSYWYHGGFDAKQKHSNRVNICFQFEDYAYFTARINKPLSPIVPIDDPLCATAEVVDYNYHPRIFGIPYKRLQIRCLPGFWPGDRCDFPLLQVHTLDRLENFINKLDHYTLKSIEDSYGVMASFGWLNGLAAYQGFTPFHDLTYPIVGQTILTNGQDWLFFVYQLNTISFHEDLDQKDRRNICWSSGRMRLFEAVENGEVQGLNEDVFKTLLKCVLHTPLDVEQARLKPYLGKDRRTKEEIETTRQELRKWFSYAPRPHAYRHEIPLWQEIYKRHPDAPPSPWIKLV